MKKILTILLILLLPGVFFSNCKSGDGKMKITEYRNSDKKIVIPNADDADSISKIIKELFESTDDLLRVYLDEETIADIKKNEHAIEIIYDDPKTFNTEFLGKGSFKKILIPLSGDYSSGKENGSVMFLIGEDEYSSAPYRTSRGYDRIEELIELIRKY